MNKVVFRRQISLPNPEGVSRTGFDSPPNHPGIFGTYSDMALGMPNQISLTLGYTPQITTLLLRVDRWIASPLKYTYKTYILD